MDPIRLELHHAVHGRLRLRPTRALPADRQEALAAALAGLDGVVRVASRSGTGSLIVETTGDPAAFVSAAEAAGIARIRPPGPPPPLGQVARFGLLRIDAAVQKSTDGIVDLESALALALFGASVVQIGRGRILGQATSLALGALTLLDRQGRKG
jgi:hypothetical protein